MTTVTRSDVACVAPETAGYTRQPALAPWCFPCSPTPAPRSRHLRSTALSLRLPLLKVDVQECQLSSRTANAVAVIGLTAPRTPGPSAGRVVVGVDRNG